MKIKKNKERANSLVDRKYWNWNWGEKGKGFGERESENTTVTGRRVEEEACIFSLVRLNR